VEKFTPQETLAFAESIISERQLKNLNETKNLDFSFTSSDRRFRCNISFQMGYYMIVLRLLTADVPDINSL
jgi:Tfp pilus assembly pilus retraction ATPase PilT